MIKGDEFMVMILERRRSNCNVWVKYIFVQKKYAVRKESLPKSFSRFEGCYAQKEPHY